MKKILVISYYFPPYGGGSVVRIYNYCKFLKEFGWEPYVLTLSEDFYDDSYRSPALLQDLFGKAHVFRSGSMEPKAKEFRNKVFGIQKKSIWDRLVIGLAKRVVGRLMIPDRTVLWYPKAMKLGDEIMAKHDFDAVFSTAPSFTAHLLAWRLAKRHGKPFFLDYRDDWVGNPAFVKYGGPTLALNKMMERAIVKASTHVFCATSHSRALLLKKYPMVADDRISVLPNGYDPDHFRPGPKGHPGDDKGALTISYLGSLSPDRSPESLFQALVALKRDRPAAYGQLRVRIYGYCPEAFKEMAIAMGLSDSVTFHQGVSLHAVPGILRDESDIALSIQSVKVGGDTAIPGKLYEYMAMRKPILNISEPGATWTFLEDLGSPYNANYSKPGDIAAVLVRIVQDRKDGKLECGISEAEIAKFDRKNLTGQLCRAIEGKLA